VAEMDGISRKHKEQIMTGWNERKPECKAEIKAGDIVKYKDELPDEVGARFIIVWVDSPRAMMDYVPDGINFNPWIGNGCTIANLSDLEVVISG
jgi:hypothetical protein